MEWSPSWEANRLSVGKEIPHISWNPRVHYNIHKSRYLFLTRDRSIQSMTPHPSSWISILILSSHLRLGLPSGFFPSCFPTKTLYTPLLSPIRATCPTNLIILDLTTRLIFGEEYRSLSSSLSSLLYSPVTSSLSGQICSSAPYSHTPSALRSSLNVRDQVSHPYKTTGQITLLYVLIFIFLDSKLKTNDSAPNDSKHSLTSICS